MDEARRVEVVLLPGLALRVTHPRQVLGQVRVAGHGEDPERLEDIPCQQLPIRRPAFELSPKGGVQIFSRGLPSHIQHPREVVQPGRLDVHIFLGDAEELLHELEPHPYLVTEARRLHAPVLPRRQRDPRHRVREVEEPRLRAELPHVIAYPHHQGDVAGAVGEACRAPVLPHGLPEAVLQRNLPVHRPALQAFRLDRHEHEVGPRERPLSIHGRLDLHIASPLRLHPLRHDLHQAQSFGVDVYERDRASPQRIVHHYVRHHPRTEIRASCSDNHYLRSCH